MAPEAERIEEVNQYEEQLAISNKEVNRRILEEIREKQVSFCS